jgi:CheY-like chemotaxis protein
MFRLLIIEDDDSTLYHLKKYLSGAFSKHVTEFPPQIDTAITVSEAQALIEASYAKKSPYHAVILDFKLPKISGEVAEFDESLCLAVRRLLPRTLVVHISAYIADELIQNHLNDFHLHSFDSSFTLSKLNVDYPERLAIMLKGFLYGAQIEEQIELVWRVGTTQEDSQGDVTHELAALSRNITRHWEYLDDTMKEKIKRFFYVDCSVDPPRVSLL